MPAPSTENLVNPYAPPAYNGFNDAAPLGYQDVDFTYVYDLSLTGNQALRDQGVVTTNDADFCWRAVVIAFATGTFNVQFADSQNYSLSNSVVASANLLGDAASPWPVSPEVLIPAGGRIGIPVIQDTSGNPNTIQLLFRGVKRYRVALGQ